MSTRRLTDMLGPAGAAALASAVEILAESYPDDADLAVTWAGWTPTEWTFTFRRRTTPGRLVIHLPHDGERVVIDELGPSDRPGAGPLGDVGT